MFQNRYSITLICVVLLLVSSCKDAASDNDPKQNKVLLSDLSLPKDYKLQFKDKYYPEGETYNKNDSIYVFEKDGSRIAITIKYFNKSKLERVDDRINSFTEVLYSDNNSFDIKAVKVNKKLGIWLLEYTFGKEEDLMHNLYVERNTVDYRITVKSFDFDILKDIEDLYTQISKYP